MVHSYHLERVLKHVQGTGVLVSRWGLVMKIKRKSKSCMCEKCKGACSFKPGWFAPGEPEKAAEYLGLNLQEFFDNHIMVDWHDEDEPPTFVLSPAILGQDPGAEFPANPKGVCVFFKDGLCSIHEVKPKGCRDAFPCKMRDHETVIDEHRKEAMAWKDHQGLIRELLGREPVRKHWKPFNFGGIWL